jgi:TrmH family RNA methyltransferase
LISKSQIKELRSLHLQKFRQIYNKFIAEGDKVCIEFLRHDKYHVEEAFILDGHENEYQHLLKRLRIHVHSVNKAEMDQISQLKTPSGILLLLRRPDEGQKPDVSKGRTIYLDGIQDPGNVGTIIRLADWFGVERVIRSEDSADFFNPKVVQASMGSMVNVDLHTFDLAGLDLVGLPVYGTYMTGENVMEYNFSTPGILVLGNEGKGISETLSKLVTQRLTVPGSKDKVADSLNVATAAGIIIAAWGRNYGI